MNHIYKPFLIKADFDEKPEFSPGHGWIACASVDIGDKNAPEFIERKGLFFNKKIKNDKSLNGNFMMYVCSQEYKDNPEEGYDIYNDIFYIQKEYNPEEARKFLTDTINNIGEVTVDQLTEVFKKILNTIDWEYDIYGIDVVAEHLNNKNKM